MTPRPPRSTLFPTRRSSDLANPPALGTVERAMKKIHDGRYVLIPYSDKTHGHFTHYRSEEHTSELQSRGHLVCRLLLEKKNPRLRLCIHQIHHRSPHALHFL